MVKIFLGWGGCIGWLEWVFSVFMFFMEKILRLIWVVVVFKSDSLEWLVILLVLRGFREMMNLRLGMWGVSFRRVGM